MLRWLRVTVLPVLLASSLLVAAPAAASESVEQEFLSFLNEERTARGLAALASYWDLVDDARLHSQRMAADGTIYHNPDLASVTTGWYALGENVGMGPTVRSLHDAFMGSAPHRANILGDYNYVGVGVTVDGEGTIFVTVVFMLGASGLVEPTVSIPEGFPAADSVGFHDPQTGVWTLVEPGQLRSFYFGNPADIPMMCDWNGDGTATVGLYRRSTGFLFLRNSNTQGVASDEIFYGNPRDLPVCGDWDGDGVETIGVYRPDQGAFYLRNSNTQGVADLVVHLGNPGDLPFAGDWDGDGTDTVGVYRPSTGAVFVADENRSGAGRLVGYYGNPGDRVVAGDWDADGRDGLGVFRPSEGTFYLSNRLGSTTADLTVRLGVSQVNPVAVGW